MELLLASTRRFQAKRDVDKIFSLVGLSREGTQSPMPPPMAPYYKKSTESVYRDVTYYLIDEGSLNILSSIEDQTIRQTANY